MYLCCSDDLLMKIRENDDFYSILGMKDLTFFRRIFKFTLNPKKYEEHIVDTDQYFQ